MTVSHKLLMKLVTDGRKKNKKTLIPYLIAGTLTVMCFYILNTLAHCPYIYKDGKETFYGSQTIAIMLELASQVVGIFAVIFICYANQFLMKGRKKEMALYGVLGMSKKNITVLMLMESFLNAIICIGTGILAGTFFNKLMLLVLYKIIGQTPVEGMVLSVEGLKNTILLFLLIYGACLIYNVRSIRVGNPIELLHSDKTGEKEPKVKVLSLIIGVIALAGGYALALKTNSTVDAISILFVSIVLVMIATYCLFMAGSIFILKVLKANKKFYFKTRNFISVSNLMFRMKHNAAGLASICVLSTGVIILLTCASSLMMLGEKNINDRYPSDIKVETVTTENNMEQEYENKVKDAAKAANISLSDVVYRQCKHTVVKKNGNTLNYMDEKGYSDMNNCVDVYFLTLKDYNHYANANLSLAKDEILMYCSNNERKAKDITMFGTSYKVVGKVDYDVSYFILDPTMSLFERMIVVVPEEETLNEFLKGDKFGDQSQLYKIFVGCNIKEEITTEQQDTFADYLKAQDETMEVNFKAIDRTFFYNIYGGAFFIGIFLAVLFLMATVLIIYYKQMSEGFEDQKRFEILAKVGLTQKEAKRTIKRQVMILFFLPVVVAIMHTIVASNVLRLFLRMVLVVDVYTFALSIAVVCIIFLAVYVLVYRITSALYYEIVYGK